MVGAGVLRECLADDRITSILSVSRATSGTTHPKLREHIRSDFFNFDDARDDFRRAGACFFCLGVSSVGMAEAEYHRLTYDITINAATVLAEVNPGMTFCYVSGASTDSSERGRSMWARVKGKTENQLLRLNLRTFLLRPGYIQPLGVKSKTRLYRVFYAIMGPLYPLLRVIAPGFVSSNEAIGRCMIELATGVYGSNVLEVRDINRVGEGG
jgi:uncharacterized protein YbjT (DUF2867 family)